MKPPLKFSTNNILLRGTQLRVVHFENFEEPSCPPPLHKVDFLETQIKDGDHGVNGCSRMTSLGGKKISISRSKRSGCGDLVISEETRGRKFLVFITEDSARKVMALGEDLVMNASTTRRWQAEEAGRSVETEVTRNRAGRSLMIKTVTKNAMKWRRRVFVPEGATGEGWLSLSRNIKALLHHEVEILNEIPPLSSSGVARPGWTRIRAHRHISSSVFGDWQFMVVCRVDKPSVNWQLVGARLVEVFCAENDFELYPFSKNLAIVAAHTADERNFLLKGNPLFTTEDSITLIPWSPSINNEHPIIKEVGGWIGILGLPFHLWSLGMFETIANNFGGLDLVDDSTKLCTDLFMAKIKIKGDLGLIPSRIIIEDDSIDYMLDLRVLDDLEKNPEGVIRIFVERLEVEDDGVAPHSHVADNTFEKVGQIHGFKSPSACQLANLISPVVEKISNSSSPLNGFTNVEAPSNVDATGHTLKRKLTLFGTPVGAGEFSNSNLNSNGLPIHWSPPREIRQGLCTNPTFKRRFIRRLTSIWRQTRQKRDNLEIDDSSDEDASVPDSQNEEEEDSSATVSVTNPMDIEISSASSPPSYHSHNPSQPNSHSTASSERTLDDTITLKKDDKIYTLPLIETINNLSWTVERAADFAGAFGIKFEGDQLLQLSSIIRRDVSRGVH